MRVEVNISIISCIWQKFPLKMEREERKHAILRIFLSSNLHDGVELHGVGWSTYKQLLNIIFLQSLLFLNKILFYYMAYLQLCFVHMAVKPSLCVIWRQKKERGKNAPEREAVDLGKCSIFIYAVNILLAVLSWWGRYLLVKTTESQLSLQVQQNHTDI